MINDIQEIDNVYDSLIKYFNVSDVDLENSFRETCFNPIRYESNEKNKVDNAYQYNQSSYISFLRAQAGLTTSLKLVERLCSHGSTCNFSLFVVHVCELQCGVADWCRDL